jgi:hypothetical protein
VEVWIVTYIHTYMGGWVGERTYDWMERWDAGQLHKQRSMDGTKIVVGYLVTRRYTD